LIGLLLLIMTGTFWPGILVLIGVTKFIKHSVRGRTDRALRGLAFWGFLTLLLGAHMLWPGIILLIITSSLFNQRRYGWQP
jgi:TM2 domain-containing membrane protein YozV